MVCVAMAEIVLTTLNAKFIHAAFGLRYLLANLGPLRQRAALVEFDIHQRPVDIVEAILARHPKIVGLGVYIWNAAPSTEVVSLLKSVCPELTIVLGGPEVSFEVEEQKIVQLADYVITGEADLKFAELCQQLLDGAGPAQKIIPAAVPDLAHVVLPYDLYDDRDVAHRVIYVEASRGCPFTCEFCLSSLDIPVRQFPLPALLDHLERLLKRGVRQFKFVDRTFNLNLKVSRTILQFFNDRYQPGLFLHFEMIPDRLPEALREWIARFPSGALQFEVGIQTFHDEVAQRIKRRQDIGRLEDNFHFLRQHTGVHIHADLIAGLPGESVASFAAGFDRLVRLGPQEIQVGILKRLRGTPISRHDSDWGMVYHAEPPYEILQNKLIDFATLQRLRRFARYWDLVANSGNFVETTPLLWSWPERSDPGTRGNSSPFGGFLAWSDWLHRQLQRTHGIALVELARLLFRYLTEEIGHDAGPTARTIWRDYQRGARSDRPDFLRPYLAAETPRPARPGPALSPRRQARHGVH
jgi:radical SAM superfamily enzyme YgiQ (UPF0313 family)